MSRRPSIPLILSTILFVLLLSSCVGLGLWETYWQ